MTLEPHISRTFAWLQFPMAALVTLMHSPTGPSPIVTVRFVIEFIICGITRPVIPAFFFISGYLFFNGCSTFGPGDYLRKIGRRTRTLLIPYLAWCILFCISMAAYGMLDLRPDAQALVKLFVAGDSEKLTVTPFGNVINNLSYPEAGGHLWFIRDLMLMMLLSPLVWLLGRLNAKITIPLVSVAALLNLGIPGVGSVAPVWFTLGGLFAIHRIDVVRICHRLGWRLIAPWLTLALLFAAMVTFFDWHHINYGPKSIMVSTLNTYIGVFAYFAIASRSLYPCKRGLSVVNDSYRANRLNTLLLTLVPVCFFMYAIHPLPQIDRYIRLSDLIVTDPDWREGAAFFTAAILKLTLIPLLFYALRHMMPRTLSLLTGGRSFHDIPQTTASDYNS